MNQRHFRQLEVLEKDQENEANNLKLKMKEFVKENLKKISENIENKKHEEGRKSSTKSN